MQLEKLLQIKYWLTAKHFDFSWMLLNFERFHALHPLQDTFALTQHNPGTI
jgi:hypothetical protein